MIAVGAVHGPCDARFEPVRAALAENLARGDVGASAAVVLEGRMVADVWGGSVDEAGQVPWERDTITNVFSTTKTMTNLCALLLVDRGLLDPDAPVARYWPEFEANGKGAVLVRHLLGHTAGLPGWDEPTTQADLLDWGLVTRRLAAQAPWWEPGTASGYHGLTQGFLVGEVVRRITGLSLGTFFQEALARPLGADFHIGTGPQHDHRVAPVLPPPPIVLPDSLPRDSVLVRALANPFLDAAGTTTIPWRRAEVPAAGGHGNARSVAAVQAVLCGAAVDGHRLLSADAAELVFVRQAEGTDLVLGTPMCWGMGYALNADAVRIGPGDRSCYWYGYGGSLVVNDLDAGLTVAYVMNKMSLFGLLDPRALRIVDAAYEALAA